MVSLCCTCVESKVMSICLIFLVLFGAVGGLYISPSSQEEVEFYVTPTPTPNPDCPKDKPCHTLNEYALNSQSYFGNESKVSLLFLQGYHSLDSKSLELENKTEVKLIPVNESEIVYITIKSSNSEFIFKDISQLYVANLSFGTYMAGFFGLFGIDNVQSFYGNHIKMSLKSFTLSNVDFIEITDLYGRCLLMIQQTNNFNPFFKPSVPIHVNISKSQISDISLRIDARNTDVILKDNIITPINARIGHSNGLLMTISGQSQVQLEISDSRIFSYTVSGVSVYLNHSELSVHVHNTNVFKTHSSGFIMDTVNDSKLSMHVHNTNVFETRSGFIINTEEHSFFDAFFDHCTVNQTFDAVFIKADLSSVNVTFDECKIVHQNRDGLSFTFRSTSGIFLVRDSNITDNSRSSIQLDVGEESNITTSIIDTILSKNSFGLELDIEGQDWEQNILIQNCTFSDSAFGIRIQLSTNIIVELQRNQLINLLIVDSRFVETNFWGVFISEPTFQQMNVTLRNCVFHSNKGYALEIDAVNDSNLSAELNIEIIGSTLYSSDPSTSIIIYTFQFIPTRVNISGCDISGASIYAKSSEIIIEDSSFQRGLSVSGGSNSTSVLVERCNFSNLITGVSISANALHLSMVDSSIEDAQIEGVRIWNPYTVTLSANISILNTTISHSHTALNIVINDKSDLTIDIKDSAFVNSSYGIAVSSEQTSWQADITITNSSISNNSETGIDLSDTVGKLKLFMVNSIMKENQGRGLYIKSPGNAIVELTLEHTEIVSTSGIALEVAGVDDLSKLNNENKFTLELRNASFIKNSDPSTSQVIVQVAGYVNVTVSDCLFDGNEGTPIEVILGSLYVNGTTTFVNNNGLDGGALSLIFSKMYIVNETEVIFKNNTALGVGGAIHVQYNQAFSTCFYQLPGITNTNDMDIHLVFFDNRAEAGGDHLYGAALNDNCTVTENGITSSAIYNELFTFTNYSVSPITSEPERVCLCSHDGRAMCSDIDYIFTSEERYPGEVFNIFLVITGLEFGTVSAAVYANLLNANTNTKLGDKQQKTQQVDNSCYNISFSVLSKENETEILVLSASHVPSRYYGDRAKIEQAIHDYKSYPGIPSELLTTPVFINITMKKCPMGFRSNNKNICECEKLLRDNSIDLCTVRNNRGLIRREGGQWVGTESDEVTVSMYCPFGYCKTGNISIDLNDTDKQCVEGRSGILCGQCKPDHSLMLGSSKCSDTCEDNISLAFLLVFLVAGIVLVFLLKVLDLTVTVGTINGLIFYANIVWANQNLLFPPVEQHIDMDHTNQSNSTHLDGNHPLVQSLRVFVAWLNLDLGFETCFYVGLNAYQKTWLQFLFPIYIWALCGLIIIASRYSVLATKLFGHNSISVLATLFLLSYAKLLRIIIKALGFTYLQRNENFTAVWTEDGNIDYFRWDHAILFAVSLAMVVFLWMPYMVTLLFIHPFKIVSHLRPFRQINRWKPFFDAYVGHLKNKYQYWVGLLLLVRALLFITIICTNPYEPNVNLVAIIVTTTAIGFHPYVYKNWLLSTLEKSFLLNLTIMACGVLYANYIESSYIKAIILCTSIAIAFVEFAAIIVFHVCYVTARFVKWKRHNTWNGRPVHRLQPEGDLRHDNDEGFREPLLQSLKPRNYN